MKYAGEYDSRSEDILFVGDPNLGEEGYEILTRFFPNAKKLIWKKSPEKGAKVRSRKLLRSKKWLFTISFYNDFVFSRDDFDFMGLPLNLHPALPAIRGIGHDHIPLIENHREHGSTLHLMNQPRSDRPGPNNEIDTGRIIRVEKRFLSTTATYRDIRRANQQVILRLLADLCEQLAEWNCVETAYRELCSESDTNGLTWCDRYVSGRRLQARLEELKASSPDHRVFIQ